VLPADVLADADRYAAERGVNRSEFIADALKHEMERAA
jgi:metal-responsive CopG/Arc/MetJ family transcriptional regulator